MSKSSMLSEATSRSETPQKESNISTSTPESIIASTSTSELSTQSSSLTPEENVLTNQVCNHNDTSFDNFINKDVNTITDDDIKNIIENTNNDGYNILHYAIIKNKEDIIYKIFEYIDRNKESQSRLKELYSTKIKEYTPLLLSLECNKKNISKKIINKLIENTLNVQQKIGSFSQESEKISEKSESPSNNECLLDSNILSEPIGKDKVSPLHISVSLDTAETSIPLYEEIKDTNTPQTSSDTTVTEQLALYSQNSLETGTETKKDITLKPITITKKQKEKQQEEEQDK